MRGLLRGTGWLLLLLAGCLPTKEDPLPTVKPSPFAPPPGPVPKMPQVSPASRQEALRVDITGQKLLRANPQIGLRPVFQTIGVPAPELFHRGTDSLFITEGLSKKASTEGQLAALLSYELGRMVAEREVLASPAMRRPEVLPPMRSGVGTDSGGAFGPADGTELVEKARYERVRPKPQAPPPTPPDPQVLAKGYLEKAGFSAKDLEEVASLLRQARSHNDFEKQMLGGTVSRPWTE